MTQENKELLLKDLCGRLPYGVKASTKIGTTITVIGVYEDTIKDEVEDSYDVSFIKPYLRQMSSMTDGEVDEYNELCGCNAPYPGRAEEAVAEFMDWLNTHHFDYRGLIPMGIALEAPEDMYKTE